MEKLERKNTTSTGTFWLTLKDFILKIKIVF